MPTGATASSLTFSVRGRLRPQERPHCADRQQRMSGPSSMMDGAGLSGYHDQSRREQRRCQSELYAIMRSSITSAPHHPVAPPSTACPGGPSECSGVGPLVTYLPPTSVVLDVQPCWYATPTRPADHHLQKVDTRRPTSCAGDRRANLERGSPRADHGVHHRELRAIVKKRKRDGWGRAYLLMRART